MDTSNSITVIGAALGVGAGRMGCEQAPELLARSPLIQAIHLPLRFTAIHKQTDKVTGIAAMTAIAQFDQRLASDVAHAVTKKQKFLVLGGDQSISVGTWSGVAGACQARKQTLGLIWIDAHMDAHTPQTTETGNIHGMPLAALLGEGDRLLTECYQAQIKFKPENVCLLGVRSFEAGESELLTRLGVRVYFIEEVLSKGIATVLQQARAYVLQSCDCFGIALDIDSISPTDAPGVGTPVEPGIPLKELLPALYDCSHVPEFIGAEIVEFNPTLDVALRTEQCVADVVQALYGERK